MEPVGEAEEPILSDDLSAHQLRLVLPTMVSLAYDSMPHRVKTSSHHEDGQRSARRADPGTST